MKQVDALKSKNVCNKTDELKQIEGIFPKKAEWTDYWKTKKIMQLQSNIKFDNLE